MLFTLLLLMLWGRRIMAVVGQFAGIETVAEHTFARGCNPERTVVVESDICHHL